MTKIINENSTLEEKTAYLRELLKRGVCFWLIRVAFKKNDGETIGVLDPQYSTHNGVIQFLKDIFSAAGAPGFPTNPIRDDRHSLSGLNYQTDEPDEKGLETLAGYLDRFSNMWPVLQLYVKQFPRFIESLIDGYKSETDDDDKIGAIVFQIEIKG